MRRLVTGAAALSTFVAATTLLGAPAGEAVAAGASPGGSVAVASAPSSLTLIGHGWGHGRGMGQYGAYGYALSGWNVSQILGQYYGGTSASTVSTSQTIVVRLDELDGASSITAQGVTASAGGNVLATGTVTVTRAANSTLSVNGQAAEGGDVTLAPNGSAPVTLGIPGGTRSYEGIVTVKAATTQVWNTLSLEDYVAGVVPAESPASWGTDGMAALEAQAVAARSYALAYIAAAGGGPICDTDYCQVYDGDQDVAGTPTNSSYTYLSDQAVQATAGQVLICSTSTCGTVGQVAFTEFSSSTGGWTAGGAFTPAPDAGDATPSNPNHTWTQTVPAASIEAAWPSIGTFESMTVTARNGLGDLGGRVDSLVVAGTAGSVTMSGAQFAAYLGLRSDWFASTGVGQASAGQPSGGLDGYWILGSDGGVYPFGGAGNYGSTKGVALNAPVIGMAPTADQRGYWEVAADGGIFQFGDAGFYGSTGNVHLNRPVISMAATPTGGGYWLFAGDGGVFQFGDAGFYGSTGNVHLNQPIVGMVPTVDGKGYTLVARDGGIFQFGDAQYHGSLPGLGVSDSVVSASTTADGGGYLILGAGGTVYPFGDAPSFGNGNSAAGWPGRALAIFGHNG